MDRIAVSNIAASQSQSETPSPSTHSSPCFSKVRSSVILKRPSPFRAMVSCWPTARPPLKTGAATEQ
jgi:hypothetical protein